MALIRIGGRKYFDRQITAWMVEAGMDKTKFNELRAAFDAAQDRRTKIANGVAARDNEIAGKRPEIYQLLRSQIEAEVTADVDGRPRPNIDALQARIVELEAALAAAEKSGGA